MEVIKTYKCPVCFDQYKTRKEAEKCLAKGEPPPAPIGLVYCYEENGGYLHDNGHILVFAVVKESRERHICHTQAWAARTGFNDNLGDLDMCCAGPTSYDGKDWDFSRLHKPDPSWPETKRVLEALKKEGIKPIYP